MQLAANRSPATVARHRAHLALALVVCVSACGPTERQREYQRQYEEAQRVAAERAAQPLTPEQEEARRRTAEEGRFFAELVAEANQASQEPASDRMACETSTHEQDRALMARATAAALADARPFSRGQLVRSDEVWVSADAPGIACGSLWLEAEGGKLSYYYANGAVYGRWRVLDNADRGRPFDPSSPLARIRELCQSEWRTCEIAR
jgi:hypothetical protein